MWSGARIVRRRDASVRAKAPACRPTDECAAGQIATTHPAHMHQNKTSPQNCEQRLSITSSKLDQLLSARSSLARSPQSQRVGRMGICECGVGQGPCCDTLTCGPCRRGCASCTDCLKCGPCSRCCKECCDILTCGPCKRDCCDLFKCGPCKRACCPNCDIYVCCEPPARICHFSRHACLRAHLPPRQPHPPAHERRPLSQISRATTSARPATFPWASASAPASMAKSRSASAGQCRSKWSGEAVEGEPAASAWPHSAAVVKRWVPCSESGLGVLVVVLLGRCAAARRTRARVPRMGRAAIFLAVTSRRACQGRAAPCRMVVLFGLS